ncbi:site-specific integrase [Burkholderia ubonensis]|uniref:site-specific integrase n=1 Tax=Burkholderia ubonensis TaxID=101571 RepID=UPI0007C75C99|nr:site-specific integrase [Burkholderia ubonensis]
MLDDLRIPDLSFPAVTYGPNETPWNLDILLYKGGAKQNARNVRQLIAGGALGEPLLERLELVQQLHAEINSLIESGHSRASAERQILLFKILFGFADDKGLSLTVDQIVNTYCLWADWLYSRTRIDKGPDNAKRIRGERFLSMRVAYDYGAVVGTLLDRILGRRTTIIELTRLYWRPQRKTALGVQAEKQNLSNTFAFGRFIQDLCDGLSLEVILEKSFPIRISLRNGREIVWNTPKSDHVNYRFEHEGIATRYHLVNLRIEAEFLMFIAQTGMNAKQALNLELRHFSYISYLNGYQVKDYKARRGGAVLFEIFADYRPHFERYLAWRRKFFPRSKLLFPFIGNEGTRQDRRFQNNRVRGVCLDLGLTYIPPRELRNTRVNWLLRQSGDPDITAELAQHAKETLLAVYKRPSLQRAMAETIRFWTKVDPHQSVTPSVAPGGCTGVPLELPERPVEAPRPDCVKPSGCLWCENHRDVDSLDYIWALSSFMHLKKLELSKARIPMAEVEIPPAKHAFDRIQQKLKWYETSNETRRDWVQEAQIRIAEGEYHPEFNIEICEMEGLE